MSIRTPLFQVAMVVMLGGPVQGCARSGYPSRPDAAISDDLPWRDGIPSDTGAPDLTRRDSADGAVALNLDDRIAVAKADPAIHLLDVLANDREQLAAKPLTLVEVTTAEAGTVEVKGDRISYRLWDRDFVGRDRFRYTVRDAQGTTYTGTVDVDVMAPHSWTGYGTTDNWSDPENWCGAVEAGSCTGSSAPPGDSDDVFFNATCSRCDCDIDEAISIKSVALRHDYPGTLRQGISPVVLGVGGWKQAGGRFFGGSASIQINGPLELLGGLFKSTSAELVVQTDNTEMVRILQAVFEHNDGQVQLKGTAGGCQGGPDYSLVLGSDGIRFSSLVVDGIAPADCVSLGYVIRSGKAIVEKELIHKSQGLRGGTWELWGDLVVSANARGGNGSILFANNRTTQYYTWDGGVTGGALVINGARVEPALATTSVAFTFFHLLAGSFKAPSGHLSVHANRYWGYSTEMVRVGALGTFEHNGGRLVLTAEPGGCQGGPTFLLDVATTLSVHDLEIRGAVGGSCANNKISLGSGDQLVVLGDLEQAGSGVLSGDFVIHGDVSTPLGVGVNATLEGATDQRIAGNIAKLVVNKTGGTAVLTGNLSATEAHLQRGVLNMAGFDFTVGNLLTLDVGTTLTQAGGILSHGSLQNQGTINP